MTRARPESVLTQKERLCRLIDHEPVDRPPRWEAIAFWKQTVEEWKSGGGLASDADVQTHYGIEPMPLIGGGVGLTSMHLAGPEIKTEVIEDDGYTRVIADDLGVVRKIRIDGGESMPQFLRFPVENHHDWLTKIKPRLCPETHDFSILEKEKGQCRDYEDLPICFGMVGLYAFWRNFWGEENLAYAFYDTPETLHDMAQTWLNMHLNIAPRVLAEIAVDWIFFHEDMAFKNGPLIGPNLFETFMMPSYRELMACLRNCGQHRFMLDSDGNNGKVLEQFISLGINGLFPFEAAAGNDVLEFRGTYPEFIIFGGIDKRVLNRDKAAIEREVMGKVPALWEGRGFIPSIDHAVPPCPQENFELYLNLVRSVF